MPRLTRAKKNKANKAIWDKAMTTVQDPGDEYVNPYYMDPDGRILREVFWTSADGKYVVVNGPFPYGFARTLDAKTVETAARLHVAGNIVSRGKTTRADRYAKVRAADVIPTHNEHGEIAP